MAYQARRKMKRGGGAHLTLKQNCRDFKASTCSYAYEQPAMMCSGSECAKEGGSAVIDGAEASCDVIEIQIVGPHSVRMQKQAVV